MQTKMKQSSVSNSLMSAVYIGGNASCFPVPGEGLPSECEVVNSVHSVVF